MCAYLRVCVCGLTRWRNVNPCDRIILWGVPRCHLFNSIHCSSFSAWNGPPKLTLRHTNSTHATKRRRRETQNTKPLSSFSSLHLFCIPLCSSPLPLITHTSLYVPLLVLLFLSGCSVSSNPCHQENRKSERKKLPNKSLWHGEHLLGCSSFCVRSKSHLRLQYVSSLWTSLIVCETSPRDKWSTLPPENSH